jgi:hypothetical protein
VRPSTHPLSVPLSRALCDAHHWEPAAADEHRLTAKDLEEMTVPQLRRHIETYCPQIAPGLRAGSATKAELL